MIKNKQWIKKIIHWISLLFIVVVSSKLVYSANQDLSVNSPNQETYNQSPEFNWDYPVEGVSFTLLIDGETVFVGQESYFTPIFPLSVGAHTWEIKVQKGEELLAERENQITITPLPPPDIIHPNNEETVFFYEDQQLHFQWEDYPNIDCTYELYVDGVIVYKGKENDVYLDPQQNIDYTSKLNCWVKVAYNEQIVESSHHLFSLSPGYFFNLWADVSFLMVSTLSDRTEGTTFGPDISVTLEYRLFPYFFLEGGLGYSHYQLGFDKTNTILVHDTHFIFDTLGFSFFVKGVYFIHPVFLYGILGMQWDAVLSAQINNGSNSYRLDPLHYSHPFKFLVGAGVILRLTNFMDLRIRLLYGISVNEMLKNIAGISKSNEQYGQISIGANVFSF